MSEAMSVAMTVSMSVSMTVTVTAATLVVEYRIANPFEMRGNETEHGRLERAARVMTIGAHGKARHTDEIPLARLEVVAHHLLVARLVELGTVDVASRRARAQQRSTRVAHARMYGSAHARRLLVDLLFDHARLDVVLTRSIARDLHVRCLKRLRHVECLLVVAVHEAMAHHLADCSFGNDGTGTGQASGHEFFERALCKVFDSNSNESQVVERPRSQALLFGLPWQQGRHVFVVQNDRLGFGRQLAASTAQTAKDEMSGVRQLVATHVVVAVSGREDPFVGDERTAAVGLRFGVVRVVNDDLHVPWLFLVVDRCTARHVVRHDRSSLTARVQVEQVGATGRRRRGCFRARLVVRFLLFLLLLGHWLVDLRLADCWLLSHLVDEMRVHGVDVGPERRLRTHVNGHLIRWLIHKCIIHSSVYRWQKRIRIRLLLLLLVH